MDGSRFETLRGRDFPDPSRPAPEAHPPSSAVGTKFFYRVKRPERGVNLPPPSSSDLREGVELQNNPTV